MNTLTLAHRGWLACGLLVFALASAPGAVAEDGVNAEPESQQQAEGLTPEDIESLDTMQAELDSLRLLATSLEKRIALADEPSKTILQVRLAKTWIELLLAGNAFAEAVLAAREQGSQDSPYWGQAVAELNAHPDIARFANQELVRHMRVPPQDMGAVDQATAYSRLFDLIDLQYELFDLLFASMALSEQFGVEVGPQRQLLAAGLTDRAEMNSILLELAKTDVRDRNASLEVAPEDADLLARLAVAESRVTGLANSLQTAVGMMETLSLDTTQYREQIIASTGEISSDTFNLEVLVNLAKKWLAQLGEWVVEEGPNLLVNLLVFVLIILVSRRLATVAQKVVERLLDKSEVDLSVLLRNMLLSTVRNLVLVLGVLIALSQIGISLGPVLAGLGVAGFVIGFALQDTLSNFASGMMILIYRPFDTGDVVEAGGVSGTVSHMSLVSTTILTFDNQTIVVPNNKIWGGVIINVTAQRTRRVDLVFGISYADDIDKAERILNEIVAADERVLANPAPTIRLNELADSSVNFIVRPWVSTADYWGVYWDTLKKVKQRFDAEGISFPFPQRDLHLDSAGPLAITVRDDRGGEGAA